MSWQPNPALDPATYRLVQRGKDRTSQAMADSTNINRIIQTFMKTGTLPLTTRVPFYGDMTLQPSLIEALGQTARARVIYDSLPEQIRKETGGDYRRFDSWLRDPRNHDIARKFGILKPITPPSPTPPTPPTPTSPTPPSPTPPTPPSPK